MRAWMFLIASGLCGCVFDAAVPEDARVRCGAETECPTGYRCASALGTCVDARTQDDSAPALQSAQLTPGFARDGTIITIELTVSEPLGRAPSISAAGPAPLRFERVEDGETQTRFRFEHRVTDADPEGVFTVTAGLVDAHGNSADGLGLGSFTLDRTPPALVDDSVRRSLTAPDALVDEVSALGPLGVFDIEALTTEPLDGTPTASSAPAGLAASVELNGQLVRASFTLADAPQGSVTLSLTMIDRAGNEGRVEIDTLAVDRQDPEPPPVDGEDCIRLIRYPWGADESGGVPSVAVVHDATNPACLLLDDTATLVVDELLSNNEVITLATAPIVDAAFSRVVLGVDDASQVGVSVVDVAGNASARAPIHDVEWVATLGGKVAGSVFPNPHRVDVRPIHTASLEQSGGREVDGDAVTSADDVALTAVGAPSWVQRERGGPSEVRMFGAYDQGRGRVVAFGESSVWEWTGASWRPLTVSDPEGDGSPIDLGFSGVGYDARRERVILFVGEGLFQSETWEWDGQSFARLETHESCTPVGIGFAAAIEWHPVLERAVLIGGTTEEGPLVALMLNDDGCWEPMPGDTSAIPERAAAGVAADTANGRLVVFSGVADVTLQDTWVHDGTAWTQITGPQPPGSTSAALSQDGTGRILALAGAQENAELWALTGDTWSRLLLEPAQQAVIERNLTAMVFDEARARLMMFGGGGDTQEWMTDHFEMRSLSPRSAELTIKRVDASSFETVFGPAVVGGSGTVETTSTSLALWAGAEWADASAGPSAVLRGAQAIDAGGTILVYGGLTEPGPTDQTWLYRGDEIWQDVGPGPSARSFAAIGLDEERGVVVMFGGLPGVSATPIAETWEWSEAEGWSLFDPAAGESPPARGSGALGWDPERRELLLVGGHTGFVPFEDTWSFDGTRWQNLTPPEGQRAKRPTARLALDEARGRLMLFGDEDAGAVLGSALEWVDGGWRVRAPNDVEGNGVPLRRQRPIVGRGPFDRRVVLSGGQQPSLFTTVSVSDGTWVWDGGATTHPSILVSFDLEAALIPADAAVNRIGVSARVHGSAPGEDGEPVGARLSWWRAGRFEPLASSMAAEPTSLAYEATDAEVIASLRRHRTRKVFVAVEAPGDNGTGDAEVSVDAVELRVRYHQP